MDDGYDDGFRSDCACGRHHRPFHVGESFAFADSETASRYHNRTNHYQVHVKFRLQRDWNTEFLYALIKSAKRDKL